MGARARARDLTRREGGREAEAPAGRQEGRAGDAGQLEVAKSGGAQGRGPSGGKGGCAKARGCFGARKEAAESKKICKKSGAKGLSKSSSKKFDTFFFGCLTSFFVGVFAAGLNGYVNIKKVKLGSVMVEILDLEALLVL